MKSQGKESIVLEAFQIFLLPAFFVSLIYRAKLAFDMEDGRFAPNGTVFVLGVLTVLTAANLILWCVSKATRYLHVTTPIFLVGVVGCILLTQIAYALPDQFDSYGGKRFIASVTADRVAELTSDRSPHIYYLGSKEDEQFPRIRTLAGKYNVIVYHYDTEIDLGAASVFDVSKLPAVIKTVGGRVSYFAEGALDLAKLEELFQSTSTVYY